MPGNITFGIEAVGRAVPNASLAYRWHHDSGVAIDAIRGQWDDRECLVVCAYPERYCRHFPQEDRKRVNEIIFYRLRLTADEIESFGPIAMAETVLLAIFSAPHSDRWWSAPVIAPYRHGFELWRQSIIVEKNVNRLVDAIRKIAAHQPASLTGVASLIAVQIATYRWGCTVGGHEAPPWTDQVMNALGKVREDADLRSLPPRRG